MRPNADGKHRSSRPLPRASLCAAVLMAVALVSGARAQQPAEPAATSQQADAILQELRAIRQVLERMERKGLGRPAQAPARPTTASVGFRDRPALGSEAAPVTVVEFTDYQCPFCRRFVQNTFPLLKRDYIDTGKVRWVVRDMPLAFHANARKAAQAAHCADEQGKFWEMRELLFKNADKLQVDQLKQYAQDLGLDGAAFAACLDSDRYRAGLDADAAEAIGQRVTGTPSFVIGTVTGDQVTGRLVIGAQSQRVFASAIEQALGGGSVEAEPKGG